jgi:hypothetical protein
MRHADRPIARWLLCVPALAALAVVAPAAFVRPIIGAAALTSASPQLYVAQNATFVSVGSLVDERYDPTATLLASGDVLVAGGLDLTGAPVAQAELYDPSSATFAPAAAMISPRVGHTATLLGSGAVLFTGGLDSNGNPLNAAELYDASSGSFDQTGAMAQARSGHSATELQDGTVLIAGGSGIGEPVGAAEIYSAQAAGFSGAGAMITPRAHHTATLLGNGLVLIAGGTDANGNPVGAAELYDPSSASFSSAGSMITARTGHTATLLNDGTVLIVGGTDRNGSAIFGAESYDPAGGSFSSGASMITARSLHTATLLDDDTVLIAGGVDAGNNALASAELYDPSQAAFVADGAMSSPHVNHAASILDSGDVIIAGGTEQPVVAPTASPAGPTPSPTPSPSSAPTAIPTPTATPVAVALTFTPARIAFTTQVLIAGNASTSAPVMVTVSNPKTKKNLSATIERYVTTGDFAVNSQKTTCAAILASGAKCKVALTFTPTTTGHRLGLLAVATNTTKGAPIIVALSGSGKIGALTYSTAVRFGSVKVNRAGFKTVKFKNANAVPITITSIQVTKNTAEFVPLIAANGCVSTLPPDSICELEVAFTPKQRKAYSSALAITDDAAGSPQKITLSGAGK